MYPHWLYNRTDGARLVVSPAVEAALTGEWLDSPHAFLNATADCCDISAATRGYQHAETCTFGTPDAPEPIDAAPEDLNEVDAPGTAPEDKPLTRAAKRALAKAAKEA